MRPRRGHEPEPVPTVAVSCRALNSTTRCADALPALSTTRTVGRAQSACRLITSRSRWRRHRRPCETGLAPRPGPACCRGRGGRSVPGGPVGRSAAGPDRCWLFAASALRACDDGRGADLAADTTTMTAQNYTGFWRVGQSNLNGWGTNTRTSNQFLRTLDEAAVSFGCESSRSFGRRGPTGAAARLGDDLRPPAHPLLPHGRSQPNPRSVRPSGRPSRLPPGRGSTSRDAKPRSGQPLWAVTARGRPDRSRTVGVQNRRSEAVSADGRRSMERAAADVGDHHGAMDHRRSAAVCGCLGRLWAVTANVLNRAAPHQAALDLTGRRLLGGGGRPRTVTADPLHCRGRAPSAGVALGPLHSYEP